MRMELINGISISAEEAGKYLVKSQRVWLDEIVRHIEWSKGAVG